MLSAGVVALVVLATTAYALTSTSTSASASGAAVGVSTPEPLALNQGARLFNAVGCAKCHVPSLLGVHGEVRLYSDLLLHDMGADLDDKIVQGDAGATDGRTTPLLGVGSHPRYLHDGRAATLRDAVLAHGGEGSVVRRRFFELDAAVAQVAVTALQGAALTLPAVCERPPNSAAKLWRADGVSRGRTAFQ